MELFIILIVVAVVGTIVKEVVKSRDNKDTIKQRHDRYDTLYEIYQKKVDDLNIPTSSKIIVINQKLFYFLKDYKYYIWMRDAKINIFPLLIPYEEFSGHPNVEETDATIQITEMPISEIEYFSTEGEIYHELQISGGNGGGFSLKGAVIGSLVAGDVGAIIGSRNKTTPITSETISRDGRKTIIKLKNEIIELGHDAYDILVKMIPEKEYSVIQELRKQSIVNKENNSQSVENSNLITKQIRELAKLKDDGILTDEEFIKKKKELLSKIN